MSEIQPKTITDRELWKKAENVNKARFLTLMGQSPGTAWILAIIGIVLVLALAFLVPNPDPKIKSASQSGDRIVILTENKLFLADKKELKLKEAQISREAISVAAGKDTIAVAFRSENRVSLFDWSGNKLKDIEVESPSAVGVGSSWVYVYTGNEIKVYDNGKAVNTMNTNGVKATVTKAIQETDSVWIHDYMSLWKSSPMGWIPVPVEGEEDYRSAWVSDKINLLCKDEILTTDLNGKTIEKTPIPAWADNNSWLCSDLVSINSGKIRIGSIKDVQPYEIELSK